MSDNSKKESPDAETSFDYETAPVTPAQGQGNKPSITQNASASPAPKAEEGSDNLGSNPILKKIGRLLTNSSGSDWKQGGVELNSETRVPRPIQVHEFVYVRDLPNNSLVVKAATPVTCQYAVGGYRVTPLTAGNFTIELRDRVFDPEKLVDPKFASNFKGKSLEILATGEVARKLFEDVRDLVRGSTRNVQKEFEEKATLLVDTILEDVETRKIDNWIREVGMVDGRDNTTYRVTHNGHEVSLLRSVEGWDAFYDLRIKQGKFELNKIGAIPKLVFLALEKNEQAKQLESLEQKLRDLGLEDDPV